jgi:hypothetical protein
MKHYLVVCCRLASGLIYSYWMGAVENTYSQSSMSDLKTRVNFIWDDEYLVLKRVELKDPKEFCKFVSNYERPSVKPCNIEKFKEEVLKSYQNASANHDVLCFMYDEVSKITYRGWVKADKNLINQNIANV